MAAVSAGAQESAGGVRAPAETPAIAPQRGHLGAEQQGDLEEVRQHYQGAIAAYARVESPSAVVWNKMGIAYQMLYDLKDASRCYEESLQLRPESPEVLNNLGTVEDMLHDYRAAERSYRKSLKLEPGSALVLKNLGTNLLMQQEYAKGAEAYRQALVIDPHIFDASPGPTVNEGGGVQALGTANYLKARSCAVAGLTDCAIAYLERAFGEGAATVKKVAAEADFKSVRGTPALARLLASQQ